MLHNKPRRPEKRPHVGTDDDAKRRRIEHGQHAWQTPASAPQLQQQPQPPAAGAPAAAQLPPLPNLEQLVQHAAHQEQQEQPPPTPPEQLAKVLTVLQALVASRDAAMMAGVIGSLQPAVLVDVVLAYMARLPAQQALPPDGAAHEPWALQLLQLVAQQAQAPQLVQQGRRTSPPAQPLQEALAPQPKAQQEGVEQQQQEAAGQPPRPDLAAPVPRAAAAGAPRPSAAVLASAFRLEPVPLTQAQQAALRLGAVLRILGTDKTSRRGLRASLVAKLAAEADLATQAPAIMARLVQVWGCGGWVGVFWGGGGG